jgi:hypothetical protein
MSDVEYSMDSELNVIFVLTIRRKYDRSLIKKCFLLINQDAYHLLKEHLIAISYLYEYFVNCYYFLL